MPLLGGLAAFALAVLLYGYLVEPRWLRIRHRVLHVPLLDPRLDGLRILHISDLHLHAKPTFVNSHVRRALTVPADLVVITGDYIAKPWDIDGCAQALHEALDGRTAYGILGNHENAEYGFSIPIFQQWKVIRRLDTAPTYTALEKAGITMLNNARVKIPLKGAELTLAGVDDPFNHMMDLDKALGGIESLESTVLLCHSPDVLDEAARRGLPLVLSGHTHGGQIRMPILGKALTTGTKKPMDRPCGVLQRGDTIMHVSPGLGLSFPIRLFTRPEATVLELRASEKRLL